MKKALTIAIIGTALAATVSFVIAGGARRESTIEADALPGYDIVDVPRYERGPLIIHVPQASYERGPRIIHVPQADDETAADRANVERDEPPRPPTTMWWKRPRRPSPRRVAPQPRSAPAPKPQRRSDAPPPPVVPPRTVLSAHRRRRPKGRTRSVRRRAITPTSINLSRRAIRAGNVGEAPTEQNNPSQ